MATSRQGFIKPSQQQQSSQPAIAAEILPIELALQGGGAHGAFTWGVLDRLLQEPTLRVEGISGTSAGAMNAAVLASGFAVGGADGAREALTAFWRRVSDAALLSPLKRTPLDILLGRLSPGNSPALRAMEWTSRTFSPYELNPMGWNPLRPILEDSIDFNSLKSSPVKVFITATCVNTGQPRIFHNDEASADALLASACLPQLFQAVEIDGKAYWDGGFSGNPTISPLVRECSANDTILVQINPVKRRRTPTTASAIASRVNEISFNAPLLKELQMIALLQQVADLGHCEGQLWARMRMHRIESDYLNELDYASKMNAEWAALTALRDEGIKAADTFLAEKGHHLGKRASLDLSALLEGM